MSSHDGDERDAEVAALFRAVADDAPPASFDERDVRARYRSGRRRRVSVLAGSALAVVVAAVLVPVLVLAGNPRAGTPPGNLAAGPHVSTTKPRSPAPYAQQLPAGPSEQGDGPHGGVGPLADGTRPGCARVDRELATALAGELPGAGRGAIPVPGGCPPRGRGASVSVHGVLVSAVLLPPGTRPPAPRDGEFARQVRHTGSGATVEVYLDAPSPALRATLPAVAGALAAGR